MTVKVLLAYLALPADATVPTSPSHQPWGSAEVAAVTVRVTVAVCVKLPEVPVTVMVKPPVAAVLLAARMSVLVPVVPTGLKMAFTLLGTPEALKLTVPVKPFRGVTVMVLAPLDPCERFTLLGATENPKSGAAFTVRLIVVESVKLPEMPMTVMVAVPATAVPLAESVRVLVVEVLPGLKAAVTPAGRPDADKLTVPEKPPSGVKAIVLVPLVPCTSVRLPGVADSRKP